MSPTPPRTGHSGTGADHNDVERVRVFATDNQGSVGFLDATAHAAKMQVRYYNEDSIADLLLGNVKAVYDETYSGSGVSSDGRQTFAKEKDNVNAVEVKVTWSKAGPQQDDETLRCFVLIP